ncbi:MAG: hypothetical protein IPJ17_07755 [Holophagales bacterium]|nr:MAG: hypothetical protein IPJ17_07755 [Holophagales bacterium]
MPVTELLTRLRNHYLDHLRSGIAEARRQESDGQPEVLLEIGQGRIPRPYSLYRIDLLAGTAEDPKLTDFNPDSYLSFEPVKFEVGRLRAVLHPLHWNGVEFRGIGLPATWAPLQDWVLNEIDVNDEKPPGHDGLSGVIHGVTQPALAVDSWSLSIDFGSAPVGSLVGLVELLAGLDVRELDIGSFSMISPNASS